MELAIDYSSFFVRYFLGSFHYMYLDIISLKCTKIYAKRYN